MDAHLKGDEAARRFLESDVIASLTAQEVVARLA
jgi:hypothetical protein